MSTRTGVSLPGASHRQIEPSSGPATRYVRLRELQTLVPFSVPTIWRKSRDGSFPPAIRLSAGITAWNRESVVQWLSEKEGAK